MRTWAPSEAFEDAPARPGLGTTYLGFDPALLERVLPLVDYIETTPDSIARLRDGHARLHPDCLAELRAIGRDARVVVHGVGLSIASHDGWHEPYLKLLDELFEQVPVAWHSEHLGYTRVDGEHLGTMLAPPRTERMLDLLCERVIRLQRRFGVPFLVEHVVQMLPEYPGEYSQAAFLNELAGRTGCGLILDAYNLECDAHNHDFDIGAFLYELDGRHVREIHVACGEEFQGFLLDAHCRATRPSTLRLAQRAIHDAGGAARVVTFELLREAVPAFGHEAIAVELERLRRVLHLPRVH